MDSTTNKTISCGCCGCQPVGKCSHTGPCWFCYKCSQNTRKMNKENNNG